GFLSIIFPGMEWKIDGMDENIFFWGSESAMVLGFCLTRNTIPRPTLDEHLHLYNTFYILRIKTILFLVKEMGGFL
ncbi:MAG TPA: hypothetical protein PKK85_04880, partial [Methanobacteriaceae archaeon]|nr:hypothetical protein [Methanobacteriaceae archaeon]